MNEGATVTNASKYVSGYLVKQRCIPSSCFVKGRVGNSFGLGTRYGSLSVPWAPSANRKATYRGQTAVLAFLSEHSANTAARCGTQQAEQSSTNLALGMAATLMLTCMGGAAHAAGHTEPSNALSIPTWYEKPVWIGRRHFSG